MQVKEKLPDFVLAELYNKSLVFVDDGSKQKKVVEDFKETKKLYLGNYEKKIIVLVNDAENIYLSDGSLRFLSGILNACKLNLAHIAVINFNNNALSFSELKKQLQPEFLLSFGITALQIELPFTMPDYQVQLYDNCCIVTAPALTALNSEINDAVTEKKKLWKSLQKMFSLEK
jgi:hypothetical protein